MKKFFLLLMLILLSFFCSKKEAGKIIAHIDSEVVTLEEFNKELEKLPLNMKVLVAGEKDKRDFLDRIIMKKLLLREARKEKIEKTKEFEERLKDMKEQLLIETLLRRKISLEAKVTDEEIKDFYEKNKENFKKGKEINTRHILLKTEEEAKEIKRRILAGEDFAELAMKYSIDPNAKTTGGEVGFHPRGTLLPEYEEAAFKLKKVGDVSGIVKTPLGYHIIRLEGIRSSSYAPLGEVRDFIKETIIKEKQAAVLEGYLNDLKKNAKIVINEEYLKEKKEKEEKSEKK